jgi:iron complex transport system substrate-binding protein
MARRFFVLALLLALAGCGQAAAPAPTPVVLNSITPPPSAAPTGAPTVAPTVAAAAPTVAPGGSAVTVTDSAGRDVTIQAPPVKIVSLAPSITEILFALELGPRVAAVDDFSNYPAETQQLPKIGALGSFNVEQIAALEPDLVLAAGITPPELVQQLADLGLAVVVVGAAEASVESVFADIALVGRITGAADAAQRVTDDMRAQLTALTERLAGAASRPRVYWELDATDPARPYTVGPGSFVDELITLAGGDNIFGQGDTPYPQVSAEQVVAADPQAILLANAQYGVTVESVGQRPGWGDLTAVTGGAVYPVDADLTTRPGPRIVAGIESIARLLHPELFDGG